MAFCLPTASVLTRYGISLYFVLQVMEPARDVGCYTAVELHSGNGPVSLREFPGVNVELRRETKETKQLLEFLL